MFGLKGRLMMAKDTNKIERNRRLKLGIAAIALVTLAYAIAKITNDMSGDWWKFSLLVVGIVGFIGGYITLTDILGKKL